MPPPRILALDVGDRRIGLAITDPLGLTAQPLFTLRRSTPKPNLRADLKAIARFIRQHNIEVLLIGNPLHADGTSSPQAIKTQAFAQALHEAHPYLTLHLLDEHLTTRDAHTLLDTSGHALRSANRSGSSAGQSRSSIGRCARLNRSAIIDQVAATLLLEAFLSRNTPTLLPDPDPNTH